MKKAILEEFIKGYRAHTSPKKLSSARNIIRKSSKMEIPKAPRIEILKRKNIPVLGEQTEIVKKLDRMTSLIR